MTQPGYATRDAYATLRFTGSRIGTGRVQVILAFGRASVSVRGRQSGIACGHATLLIVCRRNPSRLQLSAHTYISRAGPRSSSFTASLPTLHDPRPLPPVPRPASPVFLALFSTYRNGRVDFHRPRHRCAPPRGDRDEPGAVGLRPDERERRLRLHDRLSTALSPVLTSLLIR